MIKKQYQIKIYEPDGTTLIQNLLPKEVRNDISFSSRINGGFGNLNLVLNRPFDDFDEGNSIKADNIIEVYVMDENHIDPLLIYTGYVSTYNSFLRENGDEGVEVSLLGLISLLTRDFFKNGLSYTVTKSSTDVGEMARDIIDQAASIFPVFSYVFGTTAKNTGNILDKTFEKRKWYNAIQDTFDLASDGWWWKIDEGGVFYFQEKPATATHTFTLEKEVQIVDGKKNFETIENFITVFYIGNGSLDRSDATSINNYGKHTAIYEQNDLDVPGATEFAEKKLADNKEPKINTRIKINTLYDIESIRVGDTCRIRNLNENQQTFTENMQIVGIDYTPDFVTLELEEIRSKFGIELQKFVTSET